MIYELCEIGLAAEFSCGKMVTGICSVYTTLLYTLHCTNQSEKGMFTAQTGSNYICSVHFVFELKLLSCDIMNVHHIIRQLQCNISTDLS